MAGVCVLKMSAAPRSAVSAVCAVCAVQSGTEGPGPGFVVVEQTTPVPDPVSNRSPYLSSARMHQGPRAANWRGVAILHHDGQLLDGRTRTQNPPP